MLKKTNKQINVQVFEDNIDMTWRIFELFASVLLFKKIEKIYSTQNWVVLLRMLGQTETHTVNVQYKSKQNSREGYQ